MAETFTGEVRNGVVVFEGGAPRRRRAGSRGVDRVAHGEGDGDDGRSAPFGHRPGRWAAERHGRAARPLPPRPAPAMTEPFADTFYYLALVNPGDTPTPGPWRWPGA